MAVFVVWLCEHRYPVRVLIGDVIYDGSVRSDLMNLLEARRLAAGRWAEYCRTSVDCRSFAVTLAATDIVISVRFQNIVLALMLIPLLARATYF